LEDLIQAGSLGLLMAIDRFDRSRGVEFLAFAIPTIVGELKHLRDKSWTVNVPRRLRSIGLQLRRAIPALAQELGHQPLVSEIAESSGYSEVVEGLQISQAFSPRSLDALVHVGEEDPVVPELSFEEEAFELLDMRQSVVLLIRQLPVRERELLYLRFFVGQSQSQIGEKLGISQMQVSRLLVKALAQLRGAANLILEANTPEDRIPTVEAVRTQLPPVQAEDDAVPDPAGPAATALPARKTRNPLP
jgi:RNA polymerase sigma-B factor